MRWPARTFLGSTGAVGLFAALILTGSCRSAPFGSVQSAEGDFAFQPGWQLATAGAVATGRNAMVASNDSLATAVGVEILRRGGNAVDAAVAVGFALAVTHPEAGNIGGGGFMLIRRANGQTFALDFRELAPAAATRDMFVEAARTGRRNASTHGYLASGVPGSVAGLTEALARHGTLPLDVIVAPAIRLASEGFVVDATFTRAIRSSSARIAPYAGAAVFLPGGAPVQPGTVLRQLDLARSLELISRGGADAFYLDGSISAAIVAEMRRGGGLITAGDLAGYRAVWRTPLQSRYRGHTLIGMPPPASGAVTIAEGLNVLTTFGELPPFGTAKNVHFVASALHRAFIDRNELVGDPDHSPIPVDLLLSAGHARRIAATIDTSRAVPTRDARSAMREGNETTHWAVADAAGNVVSATTTINDLFGSGVFVEGAGFFLNDEMDDFASVPGRPNANGVVSAEANAIAPRKRMMSSMAPTIVLDGDGRVLLLVGSRGGPRIISSVLQVIVNVIDHRMTLLDAMRAPRIHHLVSPDSMWHEPNGFAPVVVDSLQRMGYALRPIRTDTLPYIGRVVAIARRAGRWEGVVDPRYPGHAAGF